MSIQARLATILSVLVLAALACNAPSGAVGADLGREAQLAAARLQNPVEVTPASADQFALENAWDEALELPEGRTFTILVSDDLVEQRVQEEVLQTEAAEYINDVDVIFDNNAATFTFGFSLGGPRRFTATVISSIGVTEGGDLEVLVIEASLDAGGASIELDPETLAELNQSLEEGLTREVQEFEATNNQEVYMIEATAQGGNISLTGVILPLE
ncbi:MAG: hypothetical protein GYB68_09810 [Chloroflexi bacterium]|nr:hypothetical protein [Chloroflexota bacterium]